MIDSLSRSKIDEHRGIKLHMQSNAVKIQNADTRYIDACRSTFKFYQADFNSKHHKQGLHVCFELKNLKL